MPEYIDREALLAEFEWLKSVEYPYQRDRTEDAIQRIKNAPVADVAPVVHGRWLHTDLAYHWTSLDECDVCGYHDKKRRHLGDYSYCPNCGAKMVGGADNETD